MRNLIAKFAIIAGVGAAALAVPATAFASTTGTPDTQYPHPCPTVTQTVTSDFQQSGDKGSKCGDPHGNNWGDNKGDKNDHRGDRCKPELWFFGHPQGNDNQGRDWRLPCVTHQHPKCVKCVVQNVFFNARKGSTHFTEVSGPTLTWGELLKYNGLLYTVTHPQGHTFQLSLYGNPVHAAATRFWAKATTVCPKIIHRPVIWNRK